jgi:asparagine synthase (glutamine-hydrolysing)
MCGIAGYVGTIPVDQNRVESCLELMGRRGPDAVAHSMIDLPNGATAQLLHSRLSVIDLDERSNQPFSTEASIISINGEIYNYLELAEELRAQGMDFATVSDTEVASRLMEQQSLSALSQMEAMFALAWIDRRDGTVVLARDRFGEKPLLYMRASHGLFFGSEVQYLAELSGSTLEIDSTQIVRYLVNGYKDLFKRKGTFFSNVERVAPGTGLICKPEGNWEDFSFAKWDSVTVDQTLTFEEAVQGTRERITRAVELRLRSDVPVALCLSGGIDSNLILGVARNILGADVQPFSIVGSDSRYDESDAIQKSAEWFGVSPICKNMRGINLLDEIEEITRFRGAPIATANQFALWSLMGEISSAGFKVALSGIGADELFSGYYDHHLYYLDEIQREHPYLADRKMTDWIQHILPLIRNPLFQKCNGSVHDSQYVAELIFGNVLPNLEFLQPGVREMNIGWTEGNYEQSVLRNRLANELMHETVPLTLHEEDHNAMYWSVENRSPYLDSRLLAWSRTVPIKHFVVNGRAKALLRAAGQGIAPPAILSNPRKTGFNLSVIDLLPRDRSEVLDYIYDSGLGDIIDLTKAGTLLQQESFSDSENKLAFSMLSSAAFLRAFSVNERH